MDDAGDMDEGTGVWQHDSTAPIGYDLLLNRFFKLLNAGNPDLMSGGGKSYKIPPPQCLREGNKKTIFANIAEICKRMKRTEEHVTSFLFAELGTSGSTDGSRRLVIKGKFLQKQIENVLRRYISRSPTSKSRLSELTSLQWSMSLARPADLPTPSLFVARTDCTLFLGKSTSMIFLRLRKLTAITATLASHVAVFKQSRPVTLLKLARERGSRFRLFFPAFMVAYMRALVFHIWFFKNLPVTYSKYHDIMRES